MKYQCQHTACTISGSSPVDLHHVQSRKSGGGDEPWNLMPLDHRYHQELHQLGLLKMSEKYPQVKKWLSDNGWQYCTVLLKWTNKNNL